MLHVIYTVACPHTNTVYMYICADLEGIWSEAVLYPQVLKTFVGRLNRDTDYENKFEEVISEFPN